MSSASGQASEREARPAANDQLFNTICFYINDSLPLTIRDKLHDLLISNGAQSASPSSAASSSAAASPPPRFNHDTITHVITDTLDFPEYAALRPPAGAGAGVGATAAAAGVNGAEEDDKVKIVVPSWVTRSYDLQMLQQARFYSPDRAMLFSGLCVCTSELPSVESDAIASAVNTLGGQFRSDLTREVTHLLTVAEHGDKYEMAIRHGSQLGMTILLPHWLEESFKVGQLLPPNLYQFPSPPLITGLVDGPTSKTFEERLAEFWKANPELNPPRQGTQTATQELENLKKASDENASATASILGKPSYIASTAYQKSCLVDPMNNASTSSSRAGTASTSTTSLAPTSTIKDPSHCSSPIFAQRRVYLSSDLGLRPGLEQALKARIEEAGGRCWSWGVDGGKGEEEGMGRRDAFERRREAEGELRRANVVVVRSREGWEYWHAYTHPATTIGNLSWLYHVLSTQTLASPLDRLLHYPLPTMDGVPDFRGKVITISNYAGPARDYVRSMIECLGARFEGAMSKGTDYVVTASEYGAKVKHAKTWHVPLVTHLWLESCIQSWSFISPSVSSNYLSDASTTTNFTSILGNTSLSKGAIEKWAERDEVREARREGARRVEELEKEERGVQQVEEERSVEEPVKVAGKMKGKGKGRQVEPEPEPEPEAEAEPEEEDAETEDQQEAKVQEEEEQEEEAEPMAVDEEVKPEADEEEDEEEEEPVRSPPKRKTTTRVPSDDDEEEDDEEADLPKPSKKANVAVKVPKRISPKGKGKNKAPPPPASGSSSASDDEVEVTKPTSRSLAIPHSKSKSKSVSLPAPAPPSPRATTSAAPNSKSTPKGPPGRRRRRSSSSGSSSDESLPPSAKAFGKTFGLVDPENVIPRGRRAAAGKASDLLKEQMPDAIKFAKELKSSGKGKRGGRASFSGGGRPSLGRGVSEEGDEEDEPKAVRVKSKAAAVGRKRKQEVDTESDEEEEDGDGRPEVKIPISRKAPPASKKSRVAQLTATETTQEGGAVSSFDNPPKGKPAVKTRKPTIMSTGLGLDSKSSEIKEIKKLGAAWTEHAGQVTHLVVKAMSRTEKFLSCLGYVPFIVTRDWIDASLKAGELVDETPYLLHDDKKEQEIGTTLVDILARAKSKKLFDGVTVYVTKSVQPDPTTMQKILQSGNAVVNLSKLTTTLSANIIKSWKDDLAAHEADTPRVRIISCLADRQQWEPLAAKGVPIYSVEAVFHSVMKQNFDGFVKGNRIDQQL